MSEKPDLFKSVFGFVIIIMLVIFVLAGCSALGPWPSRWDVNQAKITTDIRQTVHSFDCKGDQVAQLKELSKQVEWFDLYAESKGTKDVAKLTATMKDTIKEFQERASKGAVSPLYCNLKVKIMSSQADMIAHTTQARF